MKLKHFLVVAFAFVAGMASAQQMPAIPIDPNVRIGKLDNGLTYYIRHNNWPENVANFYIAQRVGSTPGGGVSARTGPLLGAHGLQWL